MWYSIFKYFITGEWHMEWLLLYRTYSFSSRIHSSATSNAVYCFKASIWDSSSSRNCPLPYLSSLFLTSTYLHVQLPTVNLQWNVSQSLQTQHVPNLTFTLQNSFLFLLLCLSGLNRLTTLLSKGHKIIIA